ncbi:hypothetical protein FRC03_002549 [Tulasnella sp. 419]|nr:hypothetical protein FRC03_002549 [Tulasnella sp. 419]
MGYQIDEALQRRLDTAMTSLRDNRVVIASLFLPQGTVYWDDGGRTNGGDHSPIRHHQLSQLASAFGASTPGAQKPLSNKPVLPEPINSIVDDLAGKHTVPVESPTAEKKPGNPFSQGLPRQDAGIPATRSLPSRIPALNINETPTKPPQELTQPNRDSLAPSDGRQKTRRLSRTKSRSSSKRRASSVVGPTLSFLNVAHNTPWQIEPTTHGNAGLYNAVNSVGDVISRKLWVGIVDSPTDGFSEDLKVDLELRYQAEHNSLPVWVSDAEFSGAYDTFCHQVLWPTLHYAVPDAPKTRANLYESTSFEQYKAVNEKFAEAIISAYQEGDIIMVNDYHLMLLPALIREKIPNATIGFFLHVTFPSSEIFRCLAARQHLLRGMLGADLIGFQTHNHARHFRQTVHRILSLEAVPKGIQLDNHFVDVQVVPMGIDVAALYKKRHDSEVTEWVANLRQRYAGMKLIVGRDKLDEVQGVKQKFLAFERFLEKNPDYQGKVILIQVALSTTTEVETIATDRLSAIISRINARFSTLSYTPVVLLHTHDLNFNQYLALLTVADAFLVTSLREGMALRTHEFIECQEDRKRPLILSEFTGSYSFSGFRSCFVINPYDAAGTANAIRAALSISDEEAASRWNDLHSHVINQTAQAFVTSFLTRTKQAHEEHTQRLHSSIPQLATSKDILPTYRSAKKRLILLGVESALVVRDPKETRDHGFEMPEKVRKLLEGLSNDERNVVYLLSGLPISGALEKVAAALPNIGLIAEEGCFIKPRPEVLGQPTEWISMVPNLNLKWKQSCIEILNYFTERTSGSFTEDRGASIRWRYWPGDPNDSELPWARRQAAEAQNHIWDSLGERFGLRIVPGTRSFLVLPKSVSRTSAVAAILRPGGPQAAVAEASLPVDPTTAPALAAKKEIPEAWLQGGNSEKYDFVLALGGDEKLLGRINDLPGAQTVSTSTKNSQAKWKVEREKAVEVLEQFVEDFQ